MTLKSILLSIFAVVLGSVYLVFFTDLFDKPKIEIIPQIRPGRASSIPAEPGTTPVCPVTFTFNGKYDFTSVKVVNSAEFAANKFATPAWHLISDSNSVPTKSIVYGFPIRGMKPAVARAKPQPLQPAVQYTLFLEAGKLHAQCNFSTKELVETTQ